MTDGESSFARLADKQVLVTGAAGFIGSHMVERLVELGALVTGLDRLALDEANNLSLVRDRIRYEKSSLCEVSWDEFLESTNFDVIFHFAGNAKVDNSVQAPWNDFQDNLVGTLRLLEGLRNIADRPRLIATSSAAVYGNVQDSPISESTRTVPISPYGVSKLALDRYADVYANLYDLPVASIRPFAVYGPRLKKQVVFDFIRKLSESGGSLVAHGDGTQVRDFCYVKDLIEASLYVESFGRLKGEVYNVASGEGHSIRELMDVISKELGITVKVDWTGSVRSGDVQRWTADVSRLQGLGWKSDVALDEGIRRTVAWYREATQSS